MVVRNLLEVRLLLFQLRNLFWFSFDLVVHLLHSFITSSPQGLEVPTFSGVPRRTFRKQGFSFTTEKVDLSRDLVLFFEAHLDLSLFSFNLPLNFERVLRYNLDLLLFVVDLLSEFFIREVGDRR